MCDAPLDEAVRRLPAHIREFRPEVTVTHDAYGGLPGPWHPRALYLATHPHSATPELREASGQLAVFTLVALATSQVFGIAAVSPFQAVDASALLITPAGTGWWARVV